MMRREIMQRAWEIRKENKDNIWSLCLKMAWAEAKKEGAMKTVEELEELGFKRWTKGNLDRMYINAKDLGLEVGYYKTGNVQWAEFEGSSISNCQARKLLGAKTYIDLKTNKIHSDHDWLAEAASKIVGNGYEVA